MSIVVGYIPNQFGEAALAQALAECRARRRPLVVVNTSRGDALVDPRYVSDADLPALADRLARSGVDASLRRDVGTDVADDLIRIAEEEAAELVVIGIRSRSAVGKMLMGSVAQRVIMEAPCPVLTVRPDTSDRSG